MQMNTLLSYNPDKVLVGTYDHHMVEKIYQILSNCPTVMKPGYVPSVFAYNQWINTLCFLIRLRVNAYLYKHNIRRQLIKCPDDNGEVSNYKMFYRFPI